MIPSINNVQGVSAQCPFFCVVCVLRGAWGVMPSATDSCMVCARVADVQPSLHACQPRTSKMLATGPCKCMLKMVGKQKLMDSG